MKREISSYIKKIQSVLTDDLLTPKYKNLVRHSKTEGHCYAAAEALFHMLGGKSQGYSACVASFEENGQAFTHWWIKDQDGKICDPTAEQFTAVGQVPPYHLGKGCGFLTKNPSKRAQIIIERVLDLDNKTNKTKKHPLKRIA